MSNLLGLDKTWGSWTASPLPERLPAPTSQAPDWSSVKNGSLNQAELPQPKLQELADDFLPTNNTNSGLKLFPKSEAPSFPIKDPNIVKNINGTLKNIDMGKAFTNPRYIFKNIGNPLPKQPLGYYREFTVHTTGQLGRGAQRLVI